MSLRLFGRISRLLQNNSTISSSCSRSLRRSYYAGTMEPFHPYPDREPNWVSPEEAVSAVKSGNRVFMHGAAATPVTLVDALAAYGKKANLKDVEVIHIHTEGPGTYSKPEYEAFQSKC